MSVIGSDNLNAYSNFTKVQYLEKSNIELTQAIFILERLSCILSTKCIQI